MRDSTGVGRLIRLIDEERNRQGLSGRELADRSRVSSATVSRILSGSVSPDLDSVEALVVALGYRLESFLAIALNATRKNKEAELIADLADRLPEKDRLALLNLAQHFYDQQANAQ